MYLLVGLGNPGNQFKLTRHNLGFLFLDYFKKRKKFERWKFSKKFEARISKGMLFGKRVILAKPQTFMNNSGRAVFKLLQFYQISPNHLFVFHDDLDLKIGKIKISQKKGAGGHKGVESILKALGTKNFVRFRIGIFSEKFSKKKKREFVLEKLTKKEKEIIKNAFQLLEKGVEIALKENLQKAMTEINQKGQSL